MPKRPLILSAIIILGFPLGFFGRALIEPPPDRARIALDLFRQYCVPMTAGPPVTPTGGLVYLDRMPGDPFWVEALSRIELHISPDRCEVLPYVTPMTLDESARFAEGARALITEAWPMLEVMAAEADSLTGEFQADYGPDQRRNWRVLLYWQEADLPLPQTRLTVMRPGSAP